VGKIGIGYPVSELEEPIAVDRMSLPVSSNFETKKSTFPEDLVTRPPTQYPPDLA
jgi:hypothetical protein